MKSLMLSPRSSKFPQVALPKIPTFQQKVPSAATSEPREAAGPTSPLRLASSPANLPQIDQLPGDLKTSGGTSAAATPRAAAEPATPPSASGPPAVSTAPGAPACAKFLRAAASGRIGHGHWGVAAEAERCMHHQRPSELQRQRQASTNRSCRCCAASWHARRAAPTGRHSSRSG